MSTPNPHLGLGISLTTNTGQRLINLAGEMAAELLTVQFPHFDSGPPRPRSTVVFACAASTDSIDRNSECKSADAGHHLQPNPIVAR